MSISVGSIEGTITLKDQYTATARDITAETLRIKAASDDLARSIGVPFKTAERAIKQSEGERTKLLADYKRLASGLDPVARKTHEYDRAVDTLTRSLKAGIITQETYNLRLGQTKSKLDDNIHWTRRLGSEISSSLKSNLGSYLAVGAAISIIGGTIASVAKQAVTANIEAEASARKVESAIERYGTRAGVTVEDINKLASAQSRLTGVDDELIAESAALALKFNRLSGDEIPRLVRVAQDMAEVMGIDLPAATQKAGAYVNLPQQALTKLRKEGYAVGAGQEKLVKDLLRTGDIAGAQAEIFKILETQYGGAAVAARDTLGGALKALHTEWENLLESLGGEGSGVLAIALREAIESTIELIGLLGGIPGLIDDITGSENSLTKAFHASRVAVNQFISGALKGFAELVDVISKIGPMLGLAGVAVKGLNNITDLSARLRSGAAAADRNEIESAAQLTGAILGLGKAQKAGKGAADEQTAAEKALGDALSGVADEIANLEQKYLDQIRLRKAAVAGPESLTRERDIQAAQAAVLSIQNKLKKEGLSLSQAQIDRINKAVIGQKEEERLLNAIVKAQAKIGTLSIEYLTTQEKIDAELKKDLYTFTLWEKTAKENLDTINKLLPRLDSVGKGLKNIFDPKVPVELLQKIVALTEDATTAEEKRARAIAESIVLMKEAVRLGVVTPAQASAVNEAVARQNANPLFTPAEQELYDFRQSVIESFTSIGTEAKQQMALIERAFKGFEDDADLMAIKEQALADIRLRLIDAHLSQWGEFFGSLGELVGGTLGKIARQLASAISNVQAAQKAGNQLGSLVGGAGSSLGTTVGYFAAVAAIFYEIYKGVSAQIKKTNARKWGDVTQLEIVDGAWSQEAFSKDRQGQQISKALRQSIRDILDAMDAVLDDLPQITIRAQKNSKKVSAYVAGVLVGIFDSAEEATQEAIRYAITHANFDAISKEMAAALKASMDATFEELQAAIDIANKARRNRIGDVGFQYVEISDARLREMEAMQRLGIGIEDSIDARQRELDAIKNSALGIDTSAADKLRDLRSLSSGMAEAAGSARAMIEQQMALIQAQLDFAARNDRGARGGGSGSPGSNNTGGTNPNDGPGALFDFSVAVDEETQRLRDSLDEYRRMLGEIPQALSDQEINLGIWNALEKYLQNNRKYAEEAVKFAKLKTEIEFAQIKAQLILLGKWEEWAGVFNDAYNAAMQAAGQEGRAGRGGRGGGAGGGGDKQSVKDFIADKKFEQSLYGAGDYTRQRAEILKQYDEEIEKAGKDKNLRQELLALRDKEIAQLEKEKSTKTVEDYRSFLGLTSPFDDIRKTAQGLIQDIKDSPFGNARKAAMIGRVMAETERQIQRASDAMAAGLLGNLAEYITDEGVRNEALKQQAILNYQLAMETAKITYAKLLAEGKMSDATKKVFEDVFGWFDKNADKLPGGKNWTLAGGGDNGPKFKGYADEATALSTTVDKVDEELNRLAESFKSAKDDIRSTLEEINRGALGIVAPEQGFEAAKTQYEDVLAKADRGELAGFQGISGAARNYIESLKEFSPSRAAIELPSIQNALARLAQASTVKDENVIYTEKFSEFSDRQQKTVEVLQDGLGAMTDISQGQTVVQNRMLDELTALRIANQELAARLARLESGDQGNKRSTNGY